MIYLIMRSFIKRHWAFLIFLLILIIASALMILPTLNYNFPFTMDQGHDILDLREMIIGKHLLLIGPPTSILGLYHGPFWYYLMALPFVLSGGNPAALVYTVIIFYILGGLSLWFFNYKKNTPFALASSALFLLSPGLLYQARYALNSNLMPVFTIFYFLSLITALDKPKLYKFLFLGIFSGILLQIEAGFGIVFFPFTFIMLLIKRVKFREIVFSIVGFGVTLFPQFIFELRHGFNMTKSAIAALTGASTDLGSSLTFLQTVKLHLGSYDFVVSRSLALPQIFIYLILIAGAIYMAWKLRKKSADKSSKTYFQLSISFLIFVFLFYLLYTHPLKGWFLNSLYIPFIFIVASFFSDLMLLKNKLVKAVSLLILVYVLFASVRVHSTFIDLPGKRISGDPSNFRNELTAINLIYEKAGGQAFKVYDYIPSVLDYPYQYLFWWYGAKNYGYHPQNITYLDNVPEYIANNDVFFTKRLAESKDPRIFLLIEPDNEMPERRAAWLGNFSKYCTISSQKFGWGTEVREITKCK